ncbi:DUF6527 family protein [Methylorubrum thiocyanatum]|uniref:DUF6527 family protein n=1 Tax=Methylorubrum thiocyanatum TaxID=47958 RepID=UPI00365A5BEA
MGARGILRTLEGGRVGFHCPGCNEMHVVAADPSNPMPNGAKWGFNGNYDRPTFTPSVLVRTGHHVPGHSAGPCWCTYNAEHPEEPAPFACTVCHSFVTDGQIQFLSDCTHALAGQTVPLPSFDEEVGA